MRFNLLLFGLFFGGLVVQSCSSSKTISNAQDSTATLVVPGPLLTDSLNAVKPIELKQSSENKEENIDEKSLSDELNFSYLKAKSKVVWKTENDQDNYTVDIRAKKDSVIWINISVAMVSGATGLFTKDQVQFYDKINGKYFSWSYDSLSTVMGFKVDYSIIQSLIVGNEPFKRKNSKVIRENDNFVIQQQDGLVKIDNFVGPNRKLKKLQLKEDASENQMRMDFEEFASINQFLFPFSSQITLDVKNKENVLKKTIISIKYSKVELLEEPLPFPFKVPEKYLKK